MARRPAAAPRAQVERKLTQESLKRLKETRERISRGRRFSDSTEILRQFRDGVTTRNDDESTRPA